MNISAVCNTLVIRRRAVVMLYFEECCVFLLCTNCNLRNLLICVLQTLCMSSLCAHCNVYPLACTVKVLCISHDSYGRIEISFVTISLRTHADDVIEEHVRIIYSICQLLSPALLRRSYLPNTTPSLRFENSLFDCRIDFAEEPGDIVNSFAIIRAG